MSKDGDWVLEESAEACETILSVLSDRGARYRPGAPLDPRWLAGGWSSHFEFADERGRRVRCDFLSRPARADLKGIGQLMRQHADPGKPAVIDLENLILMKRTQRAKDYPVIGELARLLAPDREIRYTTDPDRILELAPAWGEGIDRPPVREALRGASREEVVVALARENDTLQLADRVRMDAYERAASKYFAQLVRSVLLDHPVRQAHVEIVELASRLLPTSPAGEERGDRTT
jgi:hypothetical protein